MKYNSIDKTCTNFIKQESTEHIWYPMDTISKHIKTRTYIQ